MSGFTIRACSKKELALAYFPSASSPHTAVNHLMAWIRRNQGLCEVLRQMGYRPTSKWLSPKEVAAVVEWLGEP